MVAIVEMVPLKDQKEGQVADLKEEQVVGLREGQEVGSIALHHVIGETVLASPKPTALCNNKQSKLDHVSSRDNECVIT